MLTRDGRKHLYRIIQAVRLREFLEWDDIYRTAFDGPFERGIDFESNFRSGRISRKRAVLLYKWIAKNYPRDAVEFEYGMHSYLYSSAAFRSEDLDRFVDGRSGTRGRQTDSDHVRPPSSPSNE